MMATKVIVYVLLAIFVFSAGHLVGYQRGQDYATQTFDAKIKEKMAFVQEQIEKVCK